MSLKNIIQNNIVDVLESAKGDRSFYMGIAIILVILFHSQGFISDFPILKVFIFGSIGVDVFLFLSGLGLCYSLTNHTTGNFYLRRFIRIFPLFLIFALIKSLYTVKFDNIVLSPFDWFCNLTTISYYRVGGTFIDWYISALILLYLLFPIFYRITNLKSMLLVTCFITVCYMGGRPYWTYDCLLGRIPIFMAGILAFRSPKELWIIVLLFWGLLPFTIYRWLSTPLINTFLVAILFGLIFVLLKYIRKFPKIKTIVDLLGRYSLEIYLGNCLAMLLKLHTLESKGIGIVSYFVLTIVFSCVLIFINKLLQKQVKV